MVSIEMPIPEKVSTNRIYSGLNWRKRAELAQLYHMCMLQHKKSKEFMLAYPVSITYTFSFKKKLLDTTNCAFMSKLLEDGLVKAGILTDDSPEYVAETVIQSKKGDADTVLINIKRAFAW